jgi:hypothetical protein
MQIAISCSNKDIEIGKKLREDLNEQHVTPWIYIYDIKPGKIWAEELDLAISDSDYVLGILTENYLPSIGGAEAYATIADGLQKKDIKFLPLFFVSPEKVDRKLIKSIQGFNFSSSYEIGLRSLLCFLKSEEPESAKVTLSKVESPTSQNPFRRVRTEFFRDNYQLLAKAFASPENEKYEIIQEDRPVFIIGGRGCGKSMILKSLTPRVLLYRFNVQTFTELRNKGVSFLGTYFKVEKGSLLMYDYNNVIELGFAQTHLPKDHKLYKNLLQKLNNTKTLPSKEIEEEPVLTAGLNAIWAITLNELNFKILKATLKELKALSETNPPIIRITPIIEQNFVHHIMLRLGNSGEDVRNIDDLIIFVDCEIAKISNYIQDLSTPFAQPKANWLRPDIKFLDSFFEILSKDFDDLRGVIFYLLIDEFENLRAIQQTIFIEWIKTAQNFVVKIASKFEGIYTNMTLQRQPLQFGQDCPHPIILDYDLFDASRKAAYQDLLVQICQNMLSIENYAQTDISKILKEQQEIELPQNLIDAEIKRIREGAKLDFSSDKIEEYRNKLQMAAIFRLLRERRKVEGRKARRKAYAGFETYTYLSSGIVRIFLNLVGMAVYRSEGNRSQIREGQSIPIEDQTWAAYVVSRAWLEKIPENYDLKGQGERIYQFIVDIGDILRERLLSHPTEPECLSIALTDPTNLNKTSNTLLADILSYSERESILFQRKETSSYRPKQPYRARSREYMLNRIYAPILGLSYRARWGRNAFTTTELNQLLDERKRDRTKRLLQKQARVETGEEKITLDILGTDI